MTLVEFWIPTLTAIGAIATAAMAIVLAYTLYGNKQQLVVSNFIAIMNFTGSDESRKNRRIVMRGYNIMNELLEKYPKIQKNEKLDDFNESCKQVCAMYERMGFLLQQNRELNEKIINWQGFTTGIMWKLLKPIMEKWEEKDKALHYRSFDFVGDQSYYIWKKEINEWLKNREENAS